MYYYLDIIQRRGQFGLIWLAAFDRAEFKKRRTVTLVKGCDLEKCCDDILRYAAEGRENSPRMNLYVTSTLLYGLCKVFREKCTITFGETARLFTKWGENARLLALMNVQDMKHSKSVHYLCVEETVMLTHIHAARKRLTKARRVKERKEDELAVPTLDDKELAELLRQADVRVEDIQVITMQEEEPLQIMEPPGSLKPTESFGGLESFLPELQDILQGKEQTIVTEQVPDVPLEKIQHLNGQEVPLELCELSEQPIVVEMEKVVEVAPEGEKTATPEGEKTTTPEGEKTATPERTAETMERHIEPRAEQEMLPAARDGRRQKKWKKNSVIEIPRKHVVRIDWLNLRRRRDQLLEKRGPQEEYTDLHEILSPLTHLIRNLPQVTAPGRRCPLTFPDLHRRLNEFQKPEEEICEMQYVREGELSVTGISGPSIGSPTPKMSSSGLRRTPSLSPQPRPDLMQPLDSIAEVVQPEMLEGGVPLEMYQTVGDLPIIVETEEPPQKKKKVEKVESSPPESIPSTASIARIESNLLSMISEALAKSEVVRFQDLSPPSSTKPLDAARHFSALLNLETKKMIKTQQIESFGDIYIYLSDQEDSHH